MSGLGSCPQSGDRDRGLEPTVDSEAQLSCVPGVRPCIAYVWGRWQGGDQGTRQKWTWLAPRPTCPWPLRRVGGGGFLKWPLAEISVGAVERLVWVSTASLAAYPQHRTNEPAEVAC